MQQSSVEVQMFCKNFSLCLEDMCNFVCYVNDIVMHNVFVCVCVCRSWQTSFITKYIGYACKYLREDFHHHVI